MSKIVNAIFRDPATGRDRYGFAVLDDAWTRHGEDPAAQLRTVLAADGYHYRVPLASLTVLADRVEVPYARPTLAYRVTEAYETTRGYETASWYDRLTVQPGTYPLEWVDIQHRPVPATAGAYYGRVQADAVLTHTHTENRVFSAVSSNDQYPNRPVTHHLAPYAYACKPGPFGGGELVVIAPAAGEVYPPSAPAPPGAGIESWADLAFLMTEVDR